VKIFVHYNNSNHRGPGKVVQNLIKGLAQLDGVTITDKPGQADLVGCLQHPGSLLDKLPRETLMGPNLFVLPQEEPAICERFQNFVVPSGWVQEKYQRTPEMANKNIWIWSVGIDTEVWRPQKSVEAPLDCFVYYKNRSLEDLKRVAATIKDMNYELLTYGKYDERELFDLCQRSKFAVLLTSTESQGIAYMNILSTGTPCFVFNKTKWTYEQNKNISAPASAVPYFKRPACGEIVTVENSGADLLMAFDVFTTKVNQGFYNPRKYIKDYHSLEMSAKLYVDLLKRSFA
jgi:hypothetical protein